MHLIYHLILIEFSLLRFNTIYYICIYYYLLYFPLLRFNIIYYRFITPFITIQNLRFLLLFITFITNGVFHLLTFIPFIHSLPFIPDYIYKLPPS